MYDPGRARVHVELWCVRYGGYELLAQFLHRSSKRPAAFVFFAASKLHSCLVVVDDDVMLQS
jgi:hypothetical protein